MKRVLSGASVVLLVALCCRSAAATPFFVRGDTDASGELDITDGIRVLSVLFLDAEPFPCREAADTDDSNTIDITDGIYVLHFLFLGGPPPAPPYPECGPDGIGPFGCEEFAPCGTVLDEFEAIVASFGILETVAGTGQFSVGNHWEEAFQGGPATEAELSRPHMALGDDAGNIYIADKDAHGIRKVTPEGNIFTVAGTDEPGDDGDEAGPATERRLNEPNGLWVRGDGTLYILDTGNGKVRRVDTNGTMETLFTVVGLRTGRGLWVADDEQLAYVSNRSALMRWRPSAGVDVYASGFSGLGNIAVDGEGNVYVTDRDAHRVYGINPQQEIIPIAGNGGFSGGGDGFPALETALAQVRGIWLHESGGYFLATQLGSQIWYVDTARIMHLFLDGNPDHVHAGDGELFTTPGEKVSNVRSVTMDRQGNLLITENDLGYVRRVVRSDS